MQIIWWYVFFFQAEDGIRYLVRSRGLGDVYKRQGSGGGFGGQGGFQQQDPWATGGSAPAPQGGQGWGCLLYTSDAADERSSVDLGGRRIITKKNSDKDVGGTIRNTK